MEILVTDPYQLAMRIRILEQKVKALEAQRDAQGRVDVAPPLSELETH